MSQSVRVVARVIAFPDKIEQLKAVLIELIEPTRAEAGCIQYDLLQNTSNPTDFTFVEEWSSTAALETHLTSQHLQKAINQINGLVTQSPDIRRYEQINLNS